MKIVWLDEAGNTTREESLPEKEALSRLQSLFDFGGETMAVSSGPCYDHDQEAGVVTIYTPGEYCRNLHKECRENGCAKLETG